ncbi:hypothetical protein [Algoriphagus sediminis]|uniref:Uncharacterized protein n=1 Tax=Algoriphagus sediminis TaxID=3057113 RepID=A0ABT7YCU4_9BACT|nr:hypothetical protein [Algoriphagus sediminis]MDN3204332.1 hypothetical protein [Algoriphagus sediminis]
MEKHQNLWKSIRKLTWALIVAFMVGVHNFYQQKEDSPESIKSKIELIEKQENDDPNKGITSCPQ